MEIKKIDAKDREPGRVATEVAVCLMGKDQAGFVRNRVQIDQVEVVNVEEMKISAGKAKSKVYTRYSGYPGGLKKDDLATVIDKKGKAEVLRRAVYGMLPTNRLRSRLMNKLKISQ